MRSNKFKLYRDVVTIDTSSHVSYHMRSQACEDSFTMGDLNRMVLRSDWADYVE